MKTNTVIHQITKDYKVIEYQVINEGKVTNVYFKVSFMDDNEFQEKFSELQEAIDYINNLTFK